MTIRNGGKNARELMRNNRKSNTEKSWNKNMCSYSENQTYRSSRRGHIIFKKNNNLKYYYKRVV